MTLPPPPIWPPRSAEEYRRDKSPPFVLVGVGVLIAFYMALIGLGYFMHGDSPMGLIVIMGAIALVAAIVYLGSASIRRRGG